jgi:HK97 gp10 family phage protein
VNDTANTAYEVALDEVPVRKVFATGRSPRKGLLQGGRQETRFLSLEEALGESLLRRKLGLPSAFPTSRSGRRLLGSQSLVRTTDFGTYRAKNRANVSQQGRNDLLESRRLVARIDGQNRLVERQDIVETVLDRNRGRSFERVIGQRFVPRPDLERELSTRGRYELSRAQGETLGGALKRSIELVEATNRGSKIKAKVSAGNDEVDYAKYVEFGTRRSRAQPFLRPALARAREELIPNVRREIRGAK